MDTPPDSTDLFIARARQGLLGRLFGPKISPVDPGRQHQGLIELEQRLKDGRVRSFLRRRKRPLLIGTAIFTLGMFGWKGGTCSLERAEKIAETCSNADYDVEPGASQRCEGRAKWWLLPAKVLPWTHAKAKKAELEIRSDELKRRLKIASLVTLDPEPLRSTPEALLRVVRDKDYPPANRREDWVYSVTALASDPEATLALAEYAKDASGRGMAMNAAFALGDLEAARKVATPDTADDNAYDFDLRRGALLCATGDESGGRMALMDGALQYQSKVGYTYPSAIAASYACGDKPAVQIDRNASETVWMAQVFAEPRWETAWSHLDTQAIMDLRAGSSTPVFMTVWLATGYPQPEEVIAHARGMPTVFDNPFTPWISGRLRMPGMFNEAPLLVDPALVTKAADSLDDLAVRLERHEVKLAPISEIEDRRGSDLRPVYENPGPTLRGAAAKLRLLGASACASMFDLACEERFIDRLPDDVVEQVAIHLYADLERNGDHARAAKLLDIALASKDPTIQLYAKLDQAMALLGEGKKKEAHAAALEAVNLVQPATQSAGRLAELVGPELTQAVGWVVTATALASGAEDVPLHVGTPSYFESDSLPRDWLALARASDPVRREARFRILTFDFFGMGVSQVLPAVIYVLHEVARDGKDPDLWVANALGPTTASMWGPNALRARAEAAKWRGDGEGEKLWIDRATKLEVLFKTPKGAGLARMAGLE